MIAMSQTEYYHFLFRQIGLIAGTVFFIGAVTSVSIVFYYWFPYARHLASRQENKKPRR